VGAAVTAARIGWLMYYLNRGFVSFNRPWRVFWLSVPAVAAIGFAVGALVVWREQRRMTLTVLAVAAALITLLSTQWSAGGIRFGD